MSGLEGQAVQRIPSPMSAMKDPETNQIWIHYGNMAFRVDQEEFIPHVVSFLNGGDPNGVRYIIKTEIIQFVVKGDLDAHSS